MPVFRWSSILATVILVIAGLTYLEHGQRGTLASEDPLADLLIRARHAAGEGHAAHPDVLVVEIDAASIDRYGRWPWPRSRIAELVAALDDAELIALDMVFSEPTQADEDQALVDAVAAHGGVITGYFFRGAEAPVTSEQVLPAHCAYIDFRFEAERTALLDFEVAELNLPALDAAALGCGFFNLGGSFDGSIRSYPLVSLHDGALYPSLAVQLAQHRLGQAAGIVVGEQGVEAFQLGELVLGAGDRMQLNWMPEVPRISALGVLDGSLAPTRWMGRSVIVGITETGIYDLRPTPVDPTYPGVFVHATAASNLLDAAPLVGTPTGDRWALVLICLAIWVACLFRTPYLRLLLFGIAGAAVVLVARQLLGTQDEVLRLTPVLGTGFLLFSIINIYEFATAARHTASLRRAFSAYVSSELLQDVLERKDALELGGEDREITVLFSDIRNFTGLSEKLTPQELVGALNAAFDPLTECILEERGMLDKYIGDALMALFNAPLQLEDHAGHACAAALAMQDALAAYNRDHLDQGLALALGVGINTGPAVIGNVGSRRRFSYTALGDAVNLASRVEGLTKAYATEILITDTTHAQLGGRHDTRLVDRVAVKGREGAVGIYELIPEDRRDADRDQRFADALGRYLEGGFAEAAAGFAALADSHGDRTARVLAARCEDLAAAPPAVWAGYYRHESK